MTCADNYDIEASSLLTKMWYRHLAGECAGVARLDGEGARNHRLEAGATQESQVCNRLLAVDAECKDELATSTRIRTMRIDRQQSRVVGCLLTVALVALSLAGCGVLSQERTVFPNEVTGSEGQRITITQIEAIIDDDDLTSDQQETALRDLGLEDERLIAILLR